MMDTRESSIGQPRLKIGLDIDGTLAYSHDVILDAYNAIKGSSFSKQDIRGWGDPNESLMTTEEFDMLHGLSWKENWRSILPSVSQEHLERLSNVCSIEILTGIPPQLRDSVKSWLRMNFPEMEFEIMHSQLTEKPFLGYDILFDDANPVADSFMTNNRKGERLYLMEQPWNRECGYETKDSRIMMVKDLGQGIDHLLSTLDG